MILDDIIDHYSLFPHPEGGFYRETYRDELVIPASDLPAGFAGPRSVCTSILYLLPQGAVSKLHRIRSDELWHFHLGGPLKIVELQKDAPPRETILGPDFKAGHTVWHRVPAGVWFGAYPLGDFTLAGCTVSPGFDFADFEMGNLDKLAAEFPHSFPFELLPA